MMTAEQYASIMQALALLARENAGLKELLVDAIEDIADLQASIPTADIDFDQFT